MIEGLKPYPEYKDSSLPGLGAIPSHWQEKRAKYLFREVDERSTTGQEELLSVSHITGVTPRSQKRVTMFMAESTVGYKRCHRGDLVVNTMWAWMGALGISPMTGLVSPAYGVYRPRGATPLSAEFAEHMLRSPRHVSEYVRRSTGIQSSRLRLYPEQFLQIPLAYPPADEQRLIVRFISSMDRHIRRYVRAKQKLIKLLEEQKQAIIHRAVTRGLNPSVRLKPSGVEWLGDVPAHWKVLRLKQVVTPIEQGWSPQCDAQPAGANEWGVLKVGCVNRDTFDENQNKRLPSSLSPIETLEVRDGDILVSRANTRELVGLAALAEKPRSKLILCDKLFRFRVRTELADPRFLVFVMRQRTSRAQIESNTNGASDSMQNVGQGVISNLFISLPDIEQQRRIVAILHEDTAALASARVRVQQELALLRELRTRLIADVVTGKLDVREAAARLPDEAEPEPLDDAETLAEAGQDTGDADLDENPQEDEA